MGVVDTFSVSSGAPATSTRTLVLTVPRAVAAGTSIVLATSRADTASQAVGLTSIVDSRGNTWALADAISLKANNEQVALSHAHLTVGLQVGDTITVTWASASSRRMAIAHVVTGLQTVAPEATSGTTVTASTDSGPVGSSNSPTATTGATRAASSLVMAAVGVANPASAPLTPGSGYTAGTSVATTVGTNDRALLTEYKPAASTGAQTATATLAASTTWAAAVATYPLAATGGSAPVANAGTSLTNVEPGRPVTVGGTDTAPAGGSIASIAWTQTDGPTVTLSATTTATVTFTTPATLQGTTVVLQKVVTDNLGAVSDPAYVSAQVLLAAERIMIGGAWQPATMSFPALTVVPGPPPPPLPGLTMTATPEPDSVPPRIRIDIADTSPVPATSLTVTRRGPGGHAIPVRTADGGPHLLSGGQATLYDYEPGYETPATFATDVTGGPTAVTELDIHDVWLIHPGVPSRSCRVTVTTLPPGVRASNTGLHKVLGSEFPVPISSGARQAASSVLGLRTFTAAEERALNLLCDDDDVLLLNIPPSKQYGWDACYVSVGDLTPSRTVAYGKAPFREWQLPIQVVGRPGGGTQAAITWNTVADTYPTSWTALTDAGITSWAQLSAPTT